MSKKFLCLFLLLSIYANVYSKVVLVKNVDGDENILRQEMLNIENTNYVIKYDYVLREDIYIPAGCTLEFEGGSLSGKYKIRGCHTIIKAGPKTIFSSDVTLTGLWDVVEAYPEWFGAKGDGIFDDAIAINKCLSFSSGSEEKPLRIIFIRPEYVVDKTISFSGKSNVFFEGTAKNIIKKMEGSIHNMFDGGYCKSIRMSNLTFDGSLNDWDKVINVNPNWSNKTFNACIIGASNTTDFILDNCVIRNFYYGVYLGGADEQDRKIDNKKNTDHISIINCIFERNKRSCIDTYNRFGLFISNNLFKDNGSVAVHIEPCMYEDLSDPFDTSDFFLSKYPADGVNITNNTFVWIDTPSMGIKLYKGVYAVNIKGNHFINASYAINSDSTKIVTITDNIIRGGNGIELYGSLGSGCISGNVLINVTRGISCSNNSSTMGCLDVHDNIIILKDKLTSAPDAFKVQNSKYHDNIIRGYFDYVLWKKKGVLDITGASNCEIYNNKLLKCQDVPVPFFIVPITNHSELSDFIKHGVRIYDNIFEQTLECDFSTNIATTRPIKPYAGQLFYDLTINKLIVFNGKSWVDAMGNDVE